VEEKSQFQLLVRKEWPPQSGVLSLKWTAVLQQLILNYPLHYEAERKKKELMECCLLFFNLSQFSEIISGKGLLFEQTQKKTVF
jgi:hypothetical protein